jgi:hypothetical protein
MQLQKQSFGYIIIFQFLLYNKKRQKKRGFFNFLKTFFKKSPKGGFGAFKKIEKTLRGLLFCVTIGTGKRRPCGKKGDLAIC